MAALWEELGNSGAGRIRPPPPHATLVPVPRTPSPHLSQFSAPARAPVLRTASCVVRTTSTDVSGRIGCEFSCGSSNTTCGSTIAVIRQPSCVRGARSAAPRLRACVCRLTNVSGVMYFPASNFVCVMKLIDSARPDLQRRVPRRDREHVSPERAPSLEFRLLGHHADGDAGEASRRELCAGADQIRRRARRHDARVARRDQRRRRLAERDQRQQLGLGPGRLRVALEADVGPVERPADEDAG